MIPISSDGAPDLQLLVERLGRKAAADRGEDYDPANNSLHGGYRYITREQWKEFDEAMARFRDRHHHGDNWNRK